MTVNASGSRHSLLYVKEVTKGTTPASPNLQTLRHKSTTLSLNKTTQASAEIRSDRQIADFRHGIRSGDGNIVGEMSLNTYDDLLAAVLCGTWSGAPGADAGVLKAGTDRSSFSILRYFEDIGVIQTSLGAEFSTFALTCSAGGIAEATFGVMANDVTTAAALPAGAVVAAATVTPILNSLTGSFLEGTGGGVVAPCTEIQMSLDNGMKNMNVIGQATAYDRSIGRSSLTGTSTFYFADKTVLDKFVNETESALKFQLRDALGTSGYDFFIPRIKYTGGPVPVQNEGPITIALPWQALLDSTTGTNLQITRVVAP